MGEGFSCRYQREGQCPHWARSQVRDFFSPYSQGWEVLSKGRNAALTTCPPKCLGIPKAKATSRSYERHSTQALAGGGLPKAGGQPLGLSPWGRSPSRDHLPGEGECIPLARVGVAFRGLWDSPGPCVPVVWKRFWIRGLAHYRADP